MVTGHDETSYLQEAFAAGANDYLIKPVNKFDLQARAASALVLKQEIDSRKQAYRELEKQLLQSKRSDSIGRLVGGVAHDFNNVLTVIIGYSRLGPIDLDPEHRLNHNLQELLKASYHATSLTGQLLALLGQQSEESKLLDLNPLVSDISKMLSRLIGEDIRLTTHICESPVSIIAATTQIEQVLINLAINARDAMPNGGELTVGTSLIEFLQP